MAVKEFKETLPDLGEGITSATVAFWHVKVGDRVNEGDDLVECVTDKATFNIPASKAGTVKQILTSVGQIIKIGDPVALIE